ncbi:hypothetical protein, partial [Lactococcus lactis]
VNTGAVDNNNQLEIIIELLKTISRRPSENKELSSAIGNLFNQTSKPTLREKNQALNQLQKELGYLFSNN